jgi:transcriptional regulator with XRE-family HTH domain
VDDRDTHNAPDFLANLRLATSCHASTAEVCRRLGINRQQYMKYLAGSSFPSRHNLRRICDFFGVDEFEMLMPHEQFRGIVRLRPGADTDAPALPWRLRDLLQQAQRQRSELSRLLGWYYMHYHSASRPGLVLRSLVSVHPWRDYTCYKRIERLSEPGAKRRPDVYKYTGVVMMIGDRLHLIDQETLTGNELSHTILYPSYRNRVQMLSGMTMGVSGADTHQPVASPVIVEALGRSIDPRRALQGCGLFQPDDPALSAPTRRYLAHVENPARPWQLLAAPLE